MFYLSSRSPSFKELAILPDPLRRRLEGKQVLLRLRTNAGQGCPQVSPRH